VTLRAYNGGMPSVRVPEDEAADPRVPVKSPLIQPLGLSDADLSDLEAFLESLTEPSRRVRPPELPPFADDRPAAARPSR